MKSMRRLGVAGLLAIACGPEVIQHADTDNGSGSGSGDTSSGDASSSGGESSTGEPPVTIPGDGPYGGGTRLVPIVDRSEDGVTQLLRWYDRELGIDCEFARDSVGDVRCLPAYSEGAAVGYDDESCGTPIVGTLHCDSVPSYVRQRIFGAASCVDGTRQQAYLRAEPIGSGDVRHASELAGSCPGSGLTYPQRFALTPVDDTMFAAATVVFERRGSLEVRAIVSDDGAFQRSELTDPRWNTACEGQVRFGAGTGTLSCNYVSALPYGFTDATCSEPLFALPQDGTCASPSGALLRAADVWYALGEAWAQPIYVNDGGSCVVDQAPPLDAFAFFTPGAQVEAPGQLAFDLVAADDGGRLHPIAVAGDGETFVLARGDRGAEDPRWYDTAIEQPCTPLVAPDGKRRCMPLPMATPNRLDHWGDATCSEIPLFETAEDPGEALVRITLLGDEACGGREVVGQQNVVGPWTEPAYTLDDDGNCVLDELPDFVHVYRLGNYPATTDAPELALVSDG